MFSGCPSAVSFVGSSGQIGLLLPRYLVNALNNIDKTDWEYSLAHTDSLSIFRRSKVKVAAGCPGGGGNHFNIGASKFTF